MENDALELGTEFEVKLGALTENRADYTVQQLITALEATTTLATLRVSGGGGVSLPHLIRRVVEPLCRCLANLRLQNENHPLQAIDFQCVHPDVARECLVALKQFGIRRLILMIVLPFPVHWLVTFCQDNSNLKVLELEFMSFTDEDVVYPIGRSTTTMSLDKLILKHVNFSTSFGATNFAHFVAHMSVSRLELGILYPAVRTDSVTKRILSGFNMPSVERLTLSPSCRVEHVQAALDAGTATVTQLTVEISRNDIYTATEKLESLTRMIRGAVILNSLTIEIFNGNLLYHRPLQLIEALEACPTVIEIQVNRHACNPHDFTEPEVQRLRRITARNSELGQFVASPSTFPNAKLLTLMLQFNDCPSGLYMLTRRLPEVFSFTKDHSLFPLMVEPNPARKLRKRRKNSY